MKHLQPIIDRCRSLDPKIRLWLGLGVSFVLFTAILLSLADREIVRLKARRTSREADLAQMMILKQRYLAARAASTGFAARLASTGGEDSAAKILEETGIKGKTLRITPSKTREAGAGFTEDVSEARIEGLTANEAVNLLFRLEKGTRPVVLKKTTIKTRFDDPSRVDMDLTIALLKAAKR
jgi:general secretion pathway protein M